MDKTEGLQLGGKIRSFGMRSGLGLAQGVGRPCHAESSGVKGGNGMERSVSGTLDNTVEPFGDVVGLNQ